jgi:protein SCO1/2/putative membrane protein
MVWAQLAGSVACLRTSLLFLLAFFFQQGAEAAQLSPSGDSPQRFGQIEPFEFTDAHDRPVTNQDLLGSPWVAIPFFVRCSGPCPSLTTDLRSRIYEELQGTGAKLVSFSVDPNYDTPEALAEYAARFDIDTESWLFLTGGEEAMGRFIRNGLKVPLDRGPKEENAIQEPDITHGTRLPVVDAEGQIAGWYQAARATLGTDPAVVDAGFDLLLDRVLHLAGKPRAAAQTSSMPLLNALLNGTAFLLLLAGWQAIRAGHKERHIFLMRSAFMVSVAFLASYLIYHLGVQRDQGPRPFNGEGWAKTAYLVLLISHILLAIVNLPMVLRVLVLARREDWEAHKRLARKTLPIWLYVSITGVVVYLLLYPLNPPPV